ASTFIATLERRAENGDWATLASLIADGTGRMTYDDASVSPGRWGYCLRWDDGGTTRYSSEAWVDVPTTAFALHPLSPNPSNGDLKVSFTLPEATPATLVLVDVSGRELTRMNVGAFGPGSHVADLTAGRRLPAGVYIVELIQGSRRTTLRASIVR
ncbi:MAG: T9SS type A sorting domain-containing protein, partial [Candidatus Eisenbacteria bacterium]